MGLESIEKPGTYLCVCGPGQVVAKTIPEANPEESWFTCQAKPLLAPARVGLRTTLTEGFENVQWFGRGPHESYVDRRSSARFGFFSGSILDQTSMYVRPQENGNKENTRWMSLQRKGPSSQSCGGLIIAACGCSENGLGMQCHRYSLEDFDGPDNKLLQRFKHACELKPKPETDICIDVQQMGVGGINSWGEKPLKQHMLQPGQPLAWSFYLRPYSAKEVSNPSTAFEMARIARD